MLGFLDESGDSGLKPAQGSSRYFVVALVTFDDNDEAEAADQRITLLRRELGFHPSYEFKFNKCRGDVREAFLRAVAPYSFFHFGVVINKARLYGEGFKYKEPFFKYVSSLVFQNAKPFLDNTTVVIDGTGSRDFRKSLQQYLKKRINEPGQRSIAKVKVQDSANNNLLQLADMIAGALHRSFGSKRDARLYRSIVGHREMRVQVWPR